MRGTIGALSSVVQNAARIPLSPRTARSGASRGIFAGRGKADQLAQMGSVSTLFQIAGRLANSIAQTEWNLCRELPPGADPKTPPVLVPVHPALDLWNKPNPFMTRSLFVESFQQHFELIGEADWLVSRVDGFTLPLELWPIRPDRLTPDPDPETFLTGWTYNAFGNSVDLGLDEVIQIRSPNPVDPYRGLGPVQTLLIELENVTNAAEYNRRFFLNDATPGGIIETPDELSEPRYRQMLERWREQHRGVHNAHRVAILEGGMRWVDRSFSMRDMQFVQMRQVDRDIIREAYGFPKPLLGETVSVRAEAEASEYIFSKWLLLSRLERIKQALNEHLLPMYKDVGKGLYFNYVSPVADDVAALTAALATRVAAYVQLVGAGVDPDDAARVCELPEMRLAKAAAG